MLRRNRKPSNSPEGEGDPRFLRFTRCDLYGQPGRGKEVTKMYYAKLLCQSHAERQEERAHFGKEKCSFYHDNAVTHVLAFFRAKLVELGYELLLHSPNSQYLVP